MKIFVSIGTTQLILGMHILLVCISRLHAQWIVCNSGTIAQLNDVAVLDSATAVAVGAYGTLLKTTDAGATWLPKQTETSRDLHSIAFYSLSHSGFAVGDRVICYTSDDGETWSVDTSRHNFTCVEYGAAINPDVYMGTQTGVVRYQHSPNGPIKERALLGGPIVCVGLQYGPMQSTLATVATNSYAYTALSASLNWDSVRIPLGVWDALSGGDLGRGRQYLVGSGGNPIPTRFLLRRMSAFDTDWRRLDGLPLPFVPYGVKALPNPAKVYVCGSKRAILVSNDTAATWSLQYGTLGFGSALRAISFFDDSIGYAVGDSGAILITKNGGVTSVGGMNEGLPESIFLYQNYPNPFNPSTTINYRLPTNHHATLKVFDLLGREVATLVNEVKRPGIHTVQWDAADLASGIYFYRLTAGDFSETKKLMLTR